MTEHRRHVLREPDVPDPGRGARLDARAGLLVRQAVREARALDEVAAVTRAAAVAVPETHPNAKDPTLRRGDKGAAHQRRSRRLEVVDAVDPTQPNGARIRRARVRDPLRRMVIRGALPYRLYFAAEEFRQDCERASGGRDATEAVRLAGGAPPWLRTNEGAPGQWEAVGRVRRAWQEAIGLVAAGVVSWVVLNHGVLEDYEACRRVRKGSAILTLRGALERLADLYEVGKIEPPPDWA